MPGRPNLAVLAAVCFLFGASCALNPQPEPPFSTSAPGNPQEGSTGRGSDLAVDGGASDPAVHDTADGGVNGSDSSIMSDTSNVGSEAGATEDGAADAAVESSSSDAGADATPEGTTAAD